ncbi:hypothetical protein D3C72_1652390 [compost metagenome]
MSCCIMALRVSAGSFFSPSASTWSISSRTPLSSMAVTTSAVRASGFVLASDAPSWPISLSSCGVVSPWARRLIMAPRDSAGSPSSCSEGRSFMNSRIPSSPICVTTPGVSASGLVRAMDLATSPMAWYSV